MDEWTPIVYTYKKCVILRGLPGVGKTTYAHLLVDAFMGSSYIASTDNFFVDKKTGQYMFDPHRLPEAHQWNQKLFEDALKKGISCVIVDNVNSKRAHIQPYVDKADQYGYPTEIVHVDSSLTCEALQARCTHNVPLYAIQRTLSGWESYPHEQHFFV